jgi:hypothetical protein
MELDELITEEVREEYGISEDASPEEALKQAFAAEIAESMGFEQDKQAKEDIRETLEDTIEIHSEHDTE